MILLQLMSIVLDFFRSFVQNRVLEMGTSNLTFPRFLSGGSILSRLIMLRLYAAEEREWECAG